MCLNTKDVTVKVAENDILVYKEVMIYKKVKKNRNRNLFQKLFGLNKFVNMYSSAGTGYEYEIGKINPTEELRPYPLWNGLDTYYVEAGYHSDTKRRADSNALFVIPKGTKYIEGWFNDNEARPNLISETIVFKGLL